MNRLLGRLQLLVLTALAIGPITVDRRGRKQHQAEKFRAPTATLDNVTDKGLANRETCEDHRLYSITAAGLDRLEQDEERRAIRRAVVKISGVETVVTP